MASIDFGVCPAMYSRSSHVGSETRACDCDLRERFLAISLHFALDQRQPAWVLWGPCHKKISALARSPLRPPPGNLFDIRLTLRVKASPAPRNSNPSASIAAQPKWASPGYRMELGDGRACRRAGRLTAHRHCGERIARSFCTLYRGEVGFRFLPDQRRPAWLH